MTDVRKRTWRWTRYEVWQGNLLLGVCHTRDGAEAFSQGLKGRARVVPVHRYRIERPVVRELRISAYADAVTDYDDETGAHLASVYHEGRLFDAWGLDSKELARPTTREAAERACRKYLRSIGYRVVRAEGT